jgi:hypothetical protein
MEQVSEFYVKYLENTPVPIDISYGRGIDKRLPLVTVAHLIAAYQLKSQLKETPLELLTLHATEAGDALEVDVLLSEVKEGKTPKTALIIKAKELGMKKKWSGEDLDSASVKSSIELVFKEYEDSLSKVHEITFDKFPNYNVVANPIDPKRPSILLTGLDEESHENIMNPEKVADDCDVLLLLATSGMGKTRCIFQHLAKNFGLYFIPSKEQSKFGITDNEMSFHFGPRDFLSIENKLHGMVDIERDENLATVNRYVKCLVLSRLLILEHLIDGISPLNWLVFQLKNSQMKSIFTEMVKAVKNYELIDLDLELERVRMVIGKKLKRIPCIFDEAQYLLKLGALKFGSRLENESRPLYSAIVNSILNLFPDRDQDKLNTLFWASGTGLSIDISENLVFSQMGRFPVESIKLERHYISNILDSADEVEKYLKRYIPDLLPLLEDHLFFWLVGRRRFAATIAEEIMVGGLGRVEHTKARLLDQMQSTWDKLIEKSKMTTAQFHDLCDLAVQLIGAFLFSGRKITVSNSADTELLLIRLFHKGIGILEYAESHQEGALEISISLKEPLVMLSGDRCFKVSEKILQCVPGTSFSSLGYLWENSVVSALIQHANANNGLIDITKVFGIAKDCLETLGIPKDFFLENYLNPTFLEKRSIESFLQIKRNVPFISPSSYAGPDLVCILGNHPTFIQTKFRKEVEVGLALRTVDHQSFYKDRNGLVPDRFKNTAENIKTQIGDNVVIRILVCYPYRGEGGELVRVSDPRTRSTSKYIELIVDGRNAISFFGKEQIGRFDTVRRQASIFSCENNDYGDVMPMDTD